MRYDLAMLSEYCLEIGLDAAMPDEATLQISLGDDTVLCFRNDDRDYDCLMGFAGTPWHAHGELMFCDSGGRYIQLDPLGVLGGLRDGSVLICTLELENKLVDRWLVHKEYNDEFGHLEPGERIIVCRARIGASD
jgi:hypothetical protein